MRAPLALLAIATSLLGGAFVAPTAAAATLHTDDFLAEGTAGWGGGAAPTWLAGGGPDGPEDPYLQVSAVGGNLATVNSGSAWSGDFRAIKAQSVSVHLRNEVGSDPLAIRLILFGPGTSNRWATTAFAAVPADGQWRRYELPFAESDLTQVSGTGDYQSLLASVNRVMLRHDPDEPSAGGTPVTAVLGIDNVTLNGPDVLAGDYNDDGVVDAADYSVWRDNLGGPEGMLKNDILGGTVGPEHYEVWRSCYGASRLAPQADPAPAPSAVVLAALGACGVLARRVRRSALGV